MLELKNISKTFFPGTINEKKALRGVDLHMETGDFITIIGGNGAGKSTLLNSIAGVFPIDEGSITIDDVELTQMPEHQRARYIGRVFQDPMMGTAAGMMIEENLAIASRRGKRPGLSWALKEEERSHFRELLKELDLGLEDRLTARVGLLSGGVGIPYRPDQTPNDILAIGEGVHRVYDEVFGPEGMTDVRLMTEMGRFVTGPYGALIARAIHFKHIYKEYVGLDACAANLIRPAMYGAYHHITVLGKENAPCDHKYDVTGGLCENNDKFAVDRMLPEIEEGDYLFLHDAGAHCYAMGYNYNGKLWCAELLLQEDGTVKMIRRAQTPKDYFATLDFTGLFDGVE